MRARSLSLLFALTALAIAGLAVAWLLLRPNALDDASPHVLTEDGPKRVASDLLELERRPSDRRDVTQSARDDRSAAVEVERPAGASPSRLRVRVTIDDGAPVHGADVGLHDTPRGSPWQRAKTDALGFAEFDAAEPGHWILTHKNEFEPARVVLHERPWPDPLRIELRREVAWLEGTLVDDLGAPLADVSLTMATPSERFSARTDADGRFVLHGSYPEPPPSADFSIASAEHAAPAEGRLLPWSEIASTKHAAPAEGRRLPWSEWEERGWPVLVAPRRAEVLLIVEDSSGVPVEDAVVAVQGDGDPADLGTAGLLEWGANANDAFGRPAYVLRPAAGPVWIEIARGVDWTWRGGCAAPESAHVALGELAPGQRVERTVRLQRSEAALLTLVVRDESGLPVTNAGYQVRFGGGRSTFKSELGSGSRCILARPLGAWTLSVHAPGREPWVRDYVADEVPSSPIEVVLPLSDVGIAVVVLGEDATPFKGARIRIDGGHGVVTGASDAQGRFTLRGLDAESTYRVKLGCKRSPCPTGSCDLAPDPPVRYDVHPEATTLEFRMRPAASIEGAWTGDAPRGTAVHLVRVEPDRDIGSSAVRAQRALWGDGTFSFPCLPGGRYRLSVLTLGREVSQPLEIDVAYGQRVVGVRLAPR